MKDVTQMTLAGHMRGLLRLGLPLIGGHLAQFAIGLTDAIMLGWYGVSELAALTLANGYFFTFFLVGSGFAWAVMPLVASFAAEDDQIMIRRATRMALWLSILFFLAALPLMLISDPVLRALGQSPDLAALAQSYLRIAGWGLLPALGVMTLKSYLAGLERTRVILAITVLAALANAALNYVLIFGHFGAPELGIAGAAIASLATHTLSLAGVVIYARWALPQHDLFGRFWRADTEMLARVFRLGWPIGLTSLSEVGLFVMAALMVGWLGTVPLAAHGIALQCASATFLVHLGLANAATVRTGSAFGRGDRDALARGGLAAALLSVGIASVTIVVFLTMPELLLTAFLNRGDADYAAILAIGVQLLALAAVFQLVDGGQVVALGLLRGVQDTRVPMILAAVAYWGIGLPVSYGLGFGLDWGAAGVWAGLVSGLATASVLLAARFVNRLRSGTGVSVAG